MVLLKAIGHLYYIYLIEKAGDILLIYEVDWYPRRLSSGHVEGVNVGKHVVQSTTQAAISYHCIQLYNTPPNRMATVACMYLTFYTKHFKIIIIIMGSYAKCLTSYTTQIAKLTATFLIKKRKDITCLELLQTFNSRSYNQ